MAGDPWMKIVKFSIKEDLTGIHRFLFHVENVVEGDAIVDRIPDLNPIEVELTERCRNR